MRQVRLQKLTRPRVPFTCDVYFTRVGSVRAKFYCPAEVCTLGCARVGGLCIVDVWMSGCVQPPQNVKLYEPDNYYRVFRQAAPRRVKLFFTT